MNSNIYLLLANLANDNNDNDMFKRALTSIYSGNHSTNWPYSRLNILVSLRNYLRKLRIKKKKSLALINMQVELAKTWKSCDNHYVRLEGVYKVRPGFKNAINDIKNYFMEQITSLPGNIPKQRGNMYTRTFIQDK